MPSLIDVVRERFEETQGRMQGIEQTAANDGRDELTDAEQSTWDELRDQAATFAERIEILSGREILDQAAAATIARINAGRTAAQQRTGTDGGPEPVYTRAGAYALDVMRMHRGDAQARARLTRAVANTTTADNPGIVPPQIVGPLLFQLGTNRPTVESFAKPDLPAVGMKVERPNITQHTNVAQQVTEKTEVVSVTFKTDLLQAPLLTWAGQTDVSWQLAERSSPGAIDLIFADLIGMYARNSNAQAGSDLAGVSANTPIAWDGTAETLVGVLAEAVVTVGTHSVDHVLPNTVWVSLDVFGQISGLVDGDGRPLLPNIGPMNAVGTGDAVSIGSLRGLAVVVDTELPAATMIVGNRAYAEFYETTGAPVRLSVLETSILGYDIGVAGMFAVLLTDPKAFVKIDVTITGLASTPPARRTASK